MDMKRLMALGSINTTPDKTEVKTTSDSISVKNKGCKGVMKERPQCATCKRKGKYQAGILAWGSSCDREDGWRKLQGETKRDCKYYLMKEDEKNAK